jgi:hypothetical protein
MVLPNGDKVIFRIGGNHPGEQILEAHDSGLLEKKKLSILRYFHHQDMKGNFLLIIYIKYMIEKQFHL